MVVFTFVGSVVMVEVVVVVMMVVVSRLSAALKVRVGCFKFGMGL